MTMTNAADTTLTAPKARSAGLSLEAKLYAGVAVFLALVVAATVKVDRRDFCPAFNRCFG